MAGQQTIACIGPSYAIADRKSAVQRAINLYMLDIEGLGEAKRVVLDSAPGLSVLLTLADDIRGTYSTGDRWFVAAGSTLYEIASGAATSIGTLLSSSGYVSMKHGRDQLVIVDGLNGYTYNLTTNTFAQITDTDFLGSNWVEELDGYFIFVSPDTDQFYISAIDDGSTFDGLDFSSADSQPDNIITQRVKKRELYLFGTRSTEVWINSGDADFPFVRYNSTPIDIGIVGKRACVYGNDTLAFVGQTDRGTGYVYEMQGHQPVRISTQAVEEALALSTDLSECSMWSYQASGNEFIGVNAPGMQTTWVFDFSVRQWHERAELVDGDWIPLRSDQMTYHQGAHYVTADAVIYTQSKDVYTLGSAPLVRERTWPHLLAPSMEPVTYRGLEVACTSGSTVAGSITLEVSNDGGYTFSSPLQRSLGAIGRFMQRVRWLLLGSAKDRVFRLRCSDAVPLTIHAGIVDA